MAWKTLLGGSVIYRGVFALGLDEATASTLFLVGAVATFVAAPLTAVIVRRPGKKTTMLAGKMFYIVVGIIVLFTGLQGYLTGAVLVAAYGVTNSIALVCSFVMIYDLREVTELKLGADLTASVLGIFTLVVGVSSAIAYAALGGVLEMSGFDPSNTAGDTIAALMGLQTWIPSILIVLSAVALLFWNISEQDHQDVVAELHGSKVGV